MQFRHSPIRIIGPRTFLRALDTSGGFLPLGRSFLGLGAGHCPVELRTKFDTDLLPIDTGALVVVGDHDRLCSPRSDNPASVVKHREVDIEAYFLAMMSAIACDA